VLLVEDDQKMSDIVRRLLERENMACDCVSTGEEASQIGHVYNYDVVILDIGLPDTSGHEILNKMRRSNMNAPVLVLSGINTIKDKTKALGFGADDYLTKPFVPEELVARIKALTRRFSGHSAPVVRVGSVELNMETKNIFVNQKLLNLTGKEYDILEFLIMRHGSTVTKAHFLTRLYPSGIDEPEAKIIDVFIHKIRRKLGRVLGKSGPLYIQTRWGRGYSFQAPDSAAYASDNVIAMSQEPA
jgi:two-component system cell cycle response regulator CtrA